MTGAPAPANRPGLSESFRDDDRFVRGLATYVRDLAGGDLHAAFVRSPVAHAQVVSIDVTAACAVQGVVRVMTAADLRAGKVPSHRKVSSAFDRAPLTSGVVRFVGDAVALVLASSAAAAQDAADLVDIRYDPLEPVLSAAEALAVDAPLVHASTGSNVALSVSVGNCDDALAGAAHVARVRMVNQRVAPSPMEPDGALVVPNPASGTIVVYTGTQRPHHVRAELARLLGLQPSAVRVVVPDVGGAFGAKYETTVELAAVSAAAMQLGRSIAWEQTRRECMVAMVHARGQIQDAALALDAENRFIGLEAQIVGDAGAYPTIGAAIPHATLRMLPGPYGIARVRAAATSVATNTTPVGAYRGAGRPEATALIERLVDIAAADLGCDPVALRRQNLLTPDRFPFTSATGMLYDVGDYRRCLDQVVRVIDYAGWRRTQSERRAARSDRLIGIGVAFWLDCTPMNHPGEFAAVEVDEDSTGRVRVCVRAGTCDQGQRHASTWAAIAAGVLGVDATAVALLRPDTDAVPRGGGTGSARSTQLAGAAVLEASRRVAGRAREVAAHLLEAARDDVVVRDGRFMVAGSPSRSVSWPDVLRAANDPVGLAPELAAELAEHGMRAEADSDQGGPTFPSGAHAAVVEVDVETGAVELLRFAAVDDCGTVVNPASVAGQQHGGIAQGIGQALLEEIRFDDLGNPLNPGFAEYLMPTADVVPSLDVRTVETPTFRNPLGAKGIGQGGAIGATPAVHNAVVDALAHLGIRHLDLPLTPERVWRAVDAARRADRLLPPRFL